MVMYKIDRRGGAGSKNRSLGRTPGMQVTFQYINTQFIISNDSVKNMPIGPPFNTDSLNWIGDNSGSDPSSGVF